MPGDTAPEAGVIEDPPWEGGTCWALAAAALFSCIGTKHLSQLSMHSRVPHLYSTDPAVFVAADLGLKQPGLHLLVAEAHEIQLSLMSDTVLRVIDFSRC